MPRTTRQPLTIRSYRLRPDQQAWLDSQPAGPSETLRALIDAEMSIKEGQAQEMWGRCEGCGDPLGPDDGLYCEGCDSAPSED